MNTDGHWLSALRVYIVTTIAANVIWEVIQLPLYTIWRTGTRGEIIFAVIHCTAGDLMIAVLSLNAAVILFGERAWPCRQFIPVMTAALLTGLDVQSRHLMVLF